MEKISAIDIGLDKETVASICNSEKSASKIIVKRRAAYTKLSQKGEISRLEYVFHLKGTGSIPRPTKSNPSRELEVEH